MQITGQRHYLWQVVVQGGAVTDILVQRRRNRKAAERFCRKVLVGQGQEPRRSVTEGLSSNIPAIEAILPSLNVAPFRLRRYGSFLEEPSAAGVSLRSGERPCHGRKGLD